MGMTQTTILDNGDRAVLVDPQHLLLRRMAASVSGWVARGAGASTTQLKAAEKAGWARRTYDREGQRLIVTGAHLTPRGERHLEMLERAAAHQQRIDAIVNGR